MWSPLYFSSPDRLATRLSLDLLQSVTYSMTYYLAPTVFHSTALVRSIIELKLCVLLPLHGLMQSYVLLIFIFATLTVQNFLRRPFWSKWQTHVASRTDEIEAQLLLIHQSHRTQHATIHLRSIQVMLKFSIPILMFLALSTNYIPCAPMHMPFYMILLSLVEESQGWFTGSHLTLLGCSRSYLRDTCVQTHLMELRLHKWHLGLVQ